MSTFALTGGQGLVPSSPQLQSVGSATLEHTSMLAQWRRSRAVLSGEAYAKRHDADLDRLNYSNLLVPFSPTMSDEQYRWYLAEAQLPGLVAQYLRVMVGGLLRKDPTLELPEEQEAARDWLWNYFTEDGRSLASFLTEALTEELTTSRCWVTVDFPRVDEGDDPSTLFPYPVLWKAEEIINWQVGRGPGGRPKLTRAVFRYVDKQFTEANPYHPQLVPIVADHHLNEQGHYEVTFYRQDSAVTVRLDNGEFTVANPTGTLDLSGEGTWVEYDTVVPQLAGNPLTTLPVFPLNGEVDCQPPMLSPLVDKEVALYNKVSRRNHLLLGAATYTPYISSDAITDDVFTELVEQGLGTWLRLPTDGSINILTPPTEALSSYQEAIRQDTEELATLGLRILSPEAGESGVALSIRNSTQLAQLGLLNTRVSQAVKEIIALMITWKTGEPLDPSELTFSLSADFDPTPLGGDWMRQVSEWYQAGLVPRSLWLRVAKLNDIVPSDYDDEEGREEMATDPTQQGAQAQGGFYPLEEV